MVSGTVEKQFRKDINNKMNLLDHYYPDANPKIHVDVSTQIVYGENMSVNGVFKNFGASWHKRRFI